MPRARRSKLDAWLASHHGVVSRGALLEMGFTQSAIRHLVDAHQWGTVFPGIYRSPAHPTTRTQFLSAICLRSPDAVIAFTTAGQELGLRGMTDPRVHILLPHPVRAAMPDVVIHRCRRVDPVDVAFTRADGVRLTSPPRTLFDAAAIIGQPATESAIEQALAENLCTLPTLLSTDQRLHHPLRPGAAEYRGALLSRPPWRGAARSDLEVRFRRGIEAIGLPAPLVNSRIEVAVGRSIEVDLAWPEYQVIGEVDHPFWHDRTERRRLDRRRDRMTAGQGWLTVRFDEVDIDFGLDEALRELGDVLVRRGWSPHPHAS